MTADDLRGVVRSFLTLTKRKEDLTHRQQDLLKEQRRLTKEMDDLKAEIVKHMKELEFPSFRFEQYRFWLQSGNKTGKKPSRDERILEILSRTPVHDQNKAEAMEKILKQSRKREKVNNATEEVISDPAEGKPEHLRYVAV